MKTALIKTMLLSATLALSLAACTTDSGMMDPESLYPAALTDCVKPVTVTERADITKSRTSAQRAALSQSFVGAYADCNAKVEGWKERRDLYVKQYEQQHYGFFTRMYRAATDASASD